MEHARCTWYPLSCSEWHSNRWSKPSKVWLHTGRILPIHRWSTIASLLHPQRCAWERVRCWILGYRQQATKRTMGHDGASLTYRGSQAKKSTMLMLPTQKSACPFLTTMPTPSELSGLSYGNIRTSKSIRMGQLSLRKTKDLRFSFRWSLKHMVYFRPPHSSGPMMTKPFHCTEQHCGVMQVHFNGSQRPERRTLQSCETKSNRALTSWNLLSLRDRNSHLSLRDQQDGKKDRNDVRRNQLRRRAKDHKTRKCQIHRPGAGWTWETVHGAASGRCLYGTTHPGGKSTSGCSTWHNTRHNQGPTCAPSGGCRDPFAA